MLYNLVFNMLYNMCHITFPKWLYNIPFWLYNIRDGYVTHPNLPDGRASCDGTGRNLIH